MMTSLTCARLARSRRRSAAPPRHRSRFRTPAELAVELPHSRLAVDVNAAPELQGAPALLDLTDQLGDETPLGSEHGAAVVGFDQEQRGKIWADSTQVT